MLLLIIKDAVFQKACNIKYAFVSLGPNSFKIVSVLLIKIIKFYMKIIIVKIKIPGLKLFVRIIFKPYCY